jgi:hypothetical protein
MILNFVRHCVYDGVSEWKAIKLIGEIKPNTVKFIKDGLLRLPFEIKKEMKPKRKRWWKAGKNEKEKIYFDLKNN